MKCRACAHRAVKKGKERRPKEAKRGKGKEKWATANWAAVMTNQWTRSTEKDHVLLYW